MKNRYRMPGIRKQNKSKMQSSKLPLAFFSDSPSKEQFAFGQIMDSMIDPSSALIISQKYPLFFPSSTHHPR
jgi:hypothetical protein